MMTVDRVRIFDVIGDVLPDLYRQVPGNIESVRSAAVQRCLDEMAVAYSNLENGSRISYSTIAAQVGYLRRHAPSHAYEVYRLIRDNPTLNMLFARKSIRVACLGGGPGSDVIGIAKYVTRNAPDRSVTGEIYDREPAWSRVWQHVNARLQNVPTLRLAVTYHAPLDMTDASAWERHMEAITQADLVTMIYTVAEFTQYRGSAEEAFSYLFGHIKSGACVLFVDNDNIYWRKWMIDLANEQRLKLSSPEHNWHPDMGDDEDERQLGDFRSMWGSTKQRPHSNWRIFYKM